MARRLRPVHPGQILRHEFLEPLGLTPYRLAKALGVSVPTVNEIARCRRAVSAEMALRLSHYFGTSPSFWLNLQALYDLDVAAARIGGKLARRKPHPRKAEGILVRT